MEVGVAVGFEAVYELEVELPTLFDDEVDGIVLEVVDAFDPEADDVPALRWIALCEAVEDGLVLLIWE